MLIVCPSCGTSYDVDLSRVPPGGRQVRCARCRSVWRAEPSQADKLMAAAAGIAPSSAGDEHAEGAFAAALGAETMAHSADEFASDTADDGQPLEEMPVGTVASDGAGNDTHAVAEEARALIEGGDVPVEVRAPPIVPNDLAGDTSPADAVDGRAVSGVPDDDVESAATRRPQRKGERVAARWPLTIVQSAVLALVLIDTALIGLRGDVVRALPQTASFYALLGLPVNLRGVTFDGVTTSMEQHEGVPILVVEGSVFNDTHKAADVPRLKFVVRNAARQEIYSWTAVPTRASLLPGEEMAFRSRLASPPVEARDLILRFVNRRDLTAGTR
jgi:predicted Zn finger-like uncharacterized protein